MEGIVKEIIAILMDDHKKVDEAISDIKRLMTLSPEESFIQLAERLTFFKDFTFKGHHVREEEVLYAWMGKQNSNSDTSIMDRIKNEHKQLEALGQKLLDAVNAALLKKSTMSNVAILSDLNDFIVIYLEHIEKEENFIFMIAEGLKLTSEQEATMLLKMKATL
jgi:hemerythrin-like domain-containing protein